ncbi:hypothetical protein D9M68_742580 [compost metagenome]
MTGVARSGASGMLICPPTSLAPLMVATWPSDLRSNSALFSPWNTLTARIWPSSDSSSSLLMLQTAFMKPSAPEVPANRSFTLPCPTARLIME